MILKIIYNDLTIKRLDLFVLKNLSQYHLSRNTIQNMIKHGHVKVNNHITTVCHYWLKNNDEVLVNHELVVKQINLPKYNYPLEIIFENNDFLVINKPNNMLVHPSAKNNTTTLVNALLNYTNELACINESDRPGIVHRLDKQTTGVMLIAKHKAYLNILKELFKTRCIEKTYIALVYHPFKETAGLINAPIGRSMHNKTKLVVSNVRSKPSITNFTVLKNYYNTALIECRPATGRTHQLRVHLQYIHHPVVGDNKYFSNQSPHDHYEFGQYLHAKSISFQCPNSKKNFYFEATLPVAFTEKINNMNANDHETSH